jgi:hypothetical protein
METEEISETLVFISTLAQLITRENFSTASDIFKLFHFLIVPYRWKYKLSSVNNDTSSLASSEISNTNSPA